MKLFINKSKGYILKKFIVEVTKGQNYTAATKAKQDIVTFLRQDGFKTIRANIPNNKLFRVILGKSIWHRSLAKVSSGDLVVFQYPSYSRVMGDFFVKQVNRIGNCTKVILIHDLDSLRHYKDSQDDIERELKFFNEFDFIICHNDKMKEWLISKGIVKTIYSLDIFDYEDKVSLNMSGQEAPIVFAGNLDKSTFLTKLNLEKSVEIFGLSPANQYPDNVSYIGAFPSDQLGKYLNGSFGLVWDGDTLKGCSGVNGEYMKYNNPHKTSLYLSLGLPVIIWSKAALAEFVVKKNVGIVIDDLSKLDDVLDNLSNAEYKTMKDNAILLSKQLRNGFFIKKTMRKILEDINK